MKFQFLLEDVSIELVDNLNDVSPVRFSDNFTELNDSHFKIHIPGIAYIMASNGELIQIQVIGELNKKNIELYLNGSVLGAILHQRKTVSFHGSSIESNGRGILFCGDSGAGKSTITYGLSQLEEFNFLTDDITPILFEDQKVLIKPISERLKLWSDTLEKFNVDKSKLDIVRSDIDKYFIPLSGDDQLVELDTIFFLEISETTDIEISKIEGTYKIQYLINNVYRNEFLLGMKSTEIVYLNFHAQIAETANCFIIKRPKNSDVLEVMEKIRTIITQ